MAKRKVMTGSGCISDRLGAAREGAGRWLETQVMQAKPSATFKPPHLTLLTLRLLGLLGWGRQSCSMQGKIPSLAHANIKSLLQS